MHDGADDDEDDNNYVCTSEKVTKSMTNILFMDQ